MHIDHIGYIVKKIDDSVPVFEQLGYSLSQSKINDIARDVSICFMADPKGVKIELIEPLSEKSPVYSLLKKNGSTPYHLCYKSDNLEADIAELTSSGFLLVHKPSPAIAMKGKHVAFLYSKMIGLIELSE